MHMECKLEEKAPMSAVGNPFIFFFFFFFSFKIPGVRADFGEYGQIRAKVYY